MSTGKTSNFSLNQWDKEDLFLMDEFNADNQAIDEALEKASLVWLYSRKLSTSNNTINIDLSSYDLSGLSELRLHLSGWHNGTSLKEVSMTLNGSTGSTDYLTVDLAAGESVSTASAMKVGKIAGSASNNHGGMNISVGLYQKGVVVQSSGICCFSNSDAAAYNCVGLPSSSLLVTQNSLTSLQLCMTDSNYKLAAGTVLVMYGVKM
jgi:hypothetical protein